MKLYTRSFKQTCSTYFWAELLGHTRKEMLMRRLFTSYEVMMVVDKWKIGGEDGANKYQRSSNK